MMNVGFYMPTKVIMSVDCILKNTALFNEFGSKALIVTGANSAKKSGALRDVLDALTMTGKQYVIFDKVMNNPTVDCVYEGAELARAKQADFIIGIGGGSPMDAAKAIALLAVQDIPKEELFSGNVNNNILPMVMIPTTAGTGSEVTPYSILTNDKLQTKTSISTPLIFPKLALLDAKYLMSLSMSDTINTALDALSHAIEGMLTIRATELSNYIAADSIQKITQCLRYLSPGKEQSPSGILPLEVREKLLYGSMLAGIVIAHTGTTAVHSMGYSLTYFKNVEHGRANALLLPSFLRFIAKREPDTVKRILATMELKSTDEFETLFLRLLGEHEQITVKEIEKFSSIAILAKNIQNSKVVPSKEDVINIYSRCLKEN